MPLPHPSTFTPRTNNHQCSLLLHKYSARGIVADYRIVFPSNPNQHSSTDISSLIDISIDLFTALCLLYESHRFKVRLIAQCEYERLNNEGEVVDTESYHHASYPSELGSALTAEALYYRHMQKIGERIEAFLCHGSSLRFTGMKHLHIAMSVLS